MKREFLKSLGLTDDAVIDQIMKANGDDINSAKATAEAQSNIYKQENETLKGSASEWQNKYNTLQNDTKDYADLKQFKVDTLAKQEESKKIDFLKSKGCKHPELLVSQIDFSKATYDDEKKTYTGLDEVLKAKQEAYKDMFEVKGTQDPIKNDPQPNLGDGLFERYKNEHPELAGINIK